MTATISISQADIELAAYVFMIFGGLIALFGGVVVYLNKTPKDQKRIYGTVK